MSLARHGQPVIITLLLLSAVVCQRASSGFVTTTEDRNPTGGEMISYIKERLVGWFRAAANVGANLFAGLAGGAAVSG